MLRLQRYQFNVTYQFTFLNASKGHDVENPHFNVNYYFSRLIFFKCIRKKYIINSTKYYKILFLSNIFCFLCNNSLTHFAEIATNNTDISGFFFKLRIVFTFLFKYSNDIILCKYSVIFSNLVKKNNLAIWHQYHKISLEII